MPSCFSSFALQRVRWPGALAQNSKRKELSWIYIRSGRLIFLSSYRLKRPTLESTAWR